MKAIKVNADYESVLFQNSSQPKINEALEFLALFLENAPLYSSKKYSADYLSYVESIRGSRPLFQNHGAYSNWWGALNNLEEERELNSKLTTTKLALKEGWISDTTILESSEEVLNFPTPSKRMIAKNPFDMSGRGFRYIEEGEKLPTFKNFPVIVEPFLDRKFDFSHYIFHDALISYENIIDTHFQYKGSIFKDWKNPSVENLSFYKDISKSEWDFFSGVLKKVTEIFNGHEYSIDSFVYSSLQTLKIHSLCEVNVRRTMGRVAYELSQKYATQKPTTVFLLLPATANAFEKLKAVLAVEQLILLSPEGSRFLVLFLMADNGEQMNMLLRRVESLLSLSELSVRIKN